MSAKRCNPLSVLFLALLFLVFILPGCDKVKNRQPDQAVSDIVMTRYLT